MNQEKTRPGSSIMDTTEGKTPKKLSPAAERALAEAEARRREADGKAPQRPKEVNGPKGPDPARYGDWENKGIASDF
jgi:hypothetical protein